jgi:hypothetical protein
LGRSNIVCHKQYQKAQFRNASRCSRKVFIMYGCQKELLWSITAVSSQLGF